MTSKYERFCTELAVAAVVADLEEEARLAARAIDTISANDATGLPAIINQQQAPAWELVMEYVDYYWREGSKPDWLDQAGL